MALDPRYVLAPSLQMYFVDKDTGAPLSGGKVFFYRDTNRTELKSVFELQGNQANYTYSPLPNPVILSAVGTIQDNNGNDVLPYYFPFDEFGDVDLYYIVVQSSGGVPQFTRQAWPNPDFSNAPASSDDRFNYIPNGQLLAHTNLPDSALVAGTNVIAQGGFTVELDDPALVSPSVNTLVFLTEQFTQAPPQSPRYLMQFTCSSFNVLETTKNIRIKWTDVNKFSTKPGTYTFAFWATSNVSLSVAINVVKFYGTSGSPEEIIPQALSTITPAMQPTLYQFEINFGLNSGKTVDLELQDDFIAIDISLPRNIAFVASFTDFVLSAGDAEIINFPVQTDADMMARGVFGWADKIDPTGMDLYLPPILTKRGMTWDASQVGDIGNSLVAIPEVDSLPIPQNNKMPMNGRSYLTGDIAPNGIPFRRLFNFLVFETPYNNNLPLFGTGPNYISALVPFSGAESDTVRITWNTAGAGSPQTADGAVPTGFTFSPMYIYGGSSTGHATLQLLASNTGIPNQLFAVCNTGFALTGTLADGGGGNATGFSITNVSGVTALQAFQNDGFTVSTTSGAALVKAGTGRFWLFGVGGVQYNMWFNVDGANTNPAAAGTAIQVNISSTYSANDVADVVREALNAFQSTNITIPGIPPAGSYFTFSSNPTALRNFYVWFSIDDIGADPLIPGSTGIEIFLLSSDTPIIIRDRLRTTLNAYQYYVPDFSGLFPRYADPNMIYDFDGNFRWSNVAFQGGANAGTFEYSQFLSHNHGMIQSLVNAGPDVNATSTVVPTITQNTNLSGGSETRPVNVYVYPYIRY